MTNFEKYRAAFAVHAPEGALQKAIEKAADFNTSEAEPIKRKPHRLVLIPAALAAAVILMGAFSVPAIYNLLSVWEFGRTKLTSRWISAAKSPLPPLKKTACGLLPMGSILTSRI